MTVTGAILASLAIAAVLAAGLPGQGATVRKPLPRKDCFFGVHFDLHPSSGDTVLGADITEENIAELLRRVRPDMVQYDCKGHAGYTGYPTKVGWPSPGIVKDSLAIWRKVTREHGVGLYIHYSGVWDMVAIAHNPDWARIGPDGQRDPNHTSVFGPYVDRLMIPQLREVFTAYDLDGAWVDGECWAAQLDWSPAALAEWTRETGLSEAPRRRGDPHWQEWKAFHRRAFERYLARWVGALRASHPRAQITSNWAYTTFMPKAPEVKLDFLSGDFSPTVSVDRARVEARYLASTGMPWDLLAWGFNWSGALGHSLKTAEHLQQEAAVVIMQGGAFQVYYQPTRAGHIVPEIIGTLEEVGRFARARQRVSHRSVSVPQVALLLSSETQFDRSDAVFTPYGTMDELEGALHALIESHYSVDILAEHQLEPRMAEFPLVVVPDSYKLADRFRAALLRYVRDGGSLLLLGEKCARLFASDLGVRLEGEPHQVGAELSTPLGVVNHNGVWQRVTLAGAEALAHRHPTRDTRTGGEVAATLASVGRGRIAAVWGPLALNHFRGHHPGTRKLVAAIAERLFPDPAFRLEGPASVEASLRRTPQGKLSLHLLNCTGMQVADRYLYTNDIPPVGPLTVKLRVAERPKAVRWVPDGGRLRWRWASGELTVTVPRLAIHGVLVVE
ncbi:MAG TPA: alpha-amylase family protein [Chthonomonadales bacterium]|nr:alpha-amylase family protein [Chthonomonadales bacterium]